MNKKLNPQGKHRGGEIGTFFEALDHRPALFLNKLEYLSCNYTVWGLTSFVHGIRIDQFTKSKCAATLKLLSAVTLS